MRVSIAALALASAALTGCVSVNNGGAGSVVADAAVAAAVADPLRPEADRARDANRKPAETVAFASVRRGSIVAELAPGGGYFTRVIARTVGPSGHVYALVSPQQAQRPGGLDAINALAAQYGNVTVTQTDYTAISLPRPADVVWTTENWHDFSNGGTTAGIARAAFAALKPGGVFYIQDHSAPGTGTSATQTLHRIDPAAVIQVATAAGFVLDAQSDHLANPEDDHTAAVRDGSVQGRTDKFALRFRKPG
jgi:predicted methyltransferase